MKILQLNKYFYQKGGAETVFFNTISTLENRGHQVIPFALKTKKTNFQNMNLILWIILNYQNPTFGLK